MVVREKEFIYIHYLKISGTEMNGEIGFDHHRYHLSEFFERVLSDFKAVFDFL